MNIIIKGKEMGGKILLNLRLKIERSMTKKIRKKRLKKVFY